MAQFNDLSGRTFGRLEVLSRAPNKGPKVRWICRCSCGKKREVAATSLTSGKSLSCGCLRKELLSADNNQTTHGMTGSPEYMSWWSMKQRCLNPNTINYRNYGGRGITICERWLNSLENFLVDMGRRPEGTSLDRHPNPNGNYEPGNCRWANRKQQGRNKSNSRYLAAFGATGTLSDWVECSGIPKTTLTKAIARLGNLEAVLMGT